MQKIGSQESWPKTSSLINSFKKFVSSFSDFIRGKVRRNMFHVGFCCSICQWKKEKREREVQNRKLNFRIVDLATSFLLRTLFA